MTASQSASLMRTMSPSRVMPALLTSDVEPAEPLDDGRDERLGLTPSRVTSACESVRACRPRASISATTLWASASVPG